MFFLPKKAATIFLIVACIVGYNASTALAHETNNYVISLIHKRVSHTHMYQRMAGLPLTKYWGAADRCHHLGCFPINKVRLERWTHRDVVARRAAYATSYPAWFATDMKCISLHEEYGETGPNTVAGYFGLIYSPSAYVDPGPSIAATYGDSWLDVPLKPQIELSYSLYQHYGFSPWSTAGACGLV